MRVDGVVMELSERDTLTLARYEQHTIDVVLDRLSVKNSNRQRLTESVEAALKLTKGVVKFLLLDPDETVQYSEKMACINCGISFASSRRATSRSTRPTARARSARDSGRASRLTPTSWCPTRSSHWPRERSRRGRARALSTSSD